MKAELETGLRLGERGSAALRGAGPGAMKRFNWFYSGAEFCENLLRGPDWHEREVSYFLKRRAGICLLTPPVSEKGINLLRPVLRKLAPYAADPAARGRLELTVNDFGTLQLAAELCPGLKLNAGRLLYENLFFIDRTKMLVLNGEAVRLFNSLGVNRFEFSTTGRRLTTNLEIAAGAGFAPEDISITLHYPYLNLTSARTCAVGMPDTGPEDSVKGINCGFECRTCSFEARHPLIKEGMHVKGNTIFLRFPEKFYSSPATLLKRRINRLVYSPFL